MAPVIRKQIHNNISPREGKIEYCVIHDTANYSRNADSNMHFLFFNP